MMVGRQPDVTLTNEQLQRDFAEPREKRRVPGTQNSRDIPQHNVTHDRNEDNVRVYLFACLPIPAQKTEDNVETNADDRQKGDC